jgi:hypothetical protein
MFTWGSKYLFGIFAAAFGAAVAYGLITGGGPVGVISMGYKGGVGEHVGYTILMSASLLALFLGIVSVISRDGDAEDMAALAGVDHAIGVRPPASSSIAGPLTGFGIACLALGVAVGQAFLYLGIAVLAVVAIEWMVQAWAERATADDGVNDVIRRRILGPIQVPMLSLLAIAVVVISLSRILLAVSKTGSVVIVSVAATFVFLSAVLIAKSRAPRSIVSALVSFGAVAVLAGGVVGAVQGERDFHHHDEVHSEDGESHSEDGESHSEEEGE